MKALIRKLLLLIVSRWLEKTLISIILVIGALSLTSMFPEVVFSSPLIYAVVAALLLLSVFISVCTCGILIFLAVNLKKVFPFLVKDNLSIEEISNATNLSLFKAELLVKIIQSVIRFWF